MTLKILATILSFFIFQNVSLGQVQANKDYFAAPAVSEVKKEKKGKSKAKARKKEFKAECQQEPAIKEAIKACVQKKEESWKLTRPKNIPKAASSSPETTVTTVPAAPNSP